MKRRQAGASLFMVALSLVLAIGAVLAAIGVFRSRTTAAGSSQTLASLEVLRTALEQFAGSTGRLPCPANPALDTGESSPAIASSVCDFPAGTIPWKTIGVRRDDAYDPWGSKISYRAYTGAAGALTQANGASMVQCDTSVPAGRSPGVLPVGLCYQAFGRHTSDAEFLNGKGLSVTDFGNMIPNVAYVLVSHGPSALGAWAPGGAQRVAPANAAELANTTATGPFIAQANSADSVDPMSAVHFDDVLAYRTIPEVVRNANLGARDWPDPAATTENVTLNTATVSESLGATSSYGDVGRQTLVMANSTITAFDSGGNQNLAVDTGGGNEGVGGVGGGNGLSETGGEGIRIKLAVNARLFGLTLNDFGFVAAGSSLWREQVELRFINSVTSAASSITREGCSADGGLASFAMLDPGFDFDTIEVRPLASTSDPILGSTISSSFFLSAFRTCAAGSTSCSSALETPANVCP